MPENYKLINGILDSKNNCIYLIDEKGNLRTFYDEESVALFVWDLPENYIQSDTSIEEFFSAT